MGALHTPYLLAAVRGNYSTLQMAARRTICVSAIFKRTPKQCALVIEIQEQFLVDKQPALLQATLLAWRAAARAQRAARLLTPSRRHLMSTVYAARGTGQHSLECCFLSS